MPILDDCINSTYEPGNIGSSIGTPPIVIHLGSLYPPDAYPVDEVEWSLDYSRVYDSGYLLLLIY